MKGYFWRFFIPGSLWMGYPLVAESQFSVAVDPKDVVIARDSFGVPHIFGPGDAHCAYGLAWATCEDHFRWVQEALLPTVGRLSLVKGKVGLLFDFAYRWMGLDTLVEGLYEKDLSPAFRIVLEAYVQGLNAYARRHPEEVLDSRLFPVSGQQVVGGYVLSGALMSGVGMALKAAKEGRFELFYAPNETGSNALAIAPHRTEDGKTWLLLNSHQPNEGRFAWYEAHTCSDEGTNILGALFPGGVSIFTGVNPHLGWAHTTNYHTLGDIYALRRRGSRYAFEGRWQRFDTRKIQLWIRWKFLKFPVTKKLYSTVHGPVFHRGRRWYAFRFPAFSDIRSAEMWWRMGKARSWAEFDSLLCTDALPLFNVIYADAQGHIFFHSSGRTPWRDSLLHWRQPVPGEEGRYLWKRLVPCSMKTRVLDPPCGYLYNANNTPAHYAKPGCETENSARWPGFQLFDYNRGDRFRRLLAAVEGPFTKDRFRAIKFDPCYDFNGTYQNNFAALYALNPSKYPQLAEAITMLKNWDRCGREESEEATLALVTHHFLTKKYQAPFAILMIKKEPLTEKECVDALRRAVHFMRKKYGTLHVPLGQVQRLMRDTVSLPLSGLREVPRAVDSRLQDGRRGLWKVTGGDCYIMWARFGPEGPEIESVNTYGASGRPSSPHYTDQMRLFVSQNFKRMTLSKEVILNSALKIYHPNPGP
ncbi:MAG: penicillin acylase family protein [Flavobacteriales bacterium]|nr:penicillin acylase family protein [Flavobacteriales bacterium]MDW8431512.1 penicillin acylase family protein [Flavobacteriales bacterium]